MRPTRRLGDAHPPAPRRASDPVGADPVGAVPARSEPARSEPAYIEPAYTEPPPAVSFAALVTLLGLTVCGGGGASYTFTLEGTGALAVRARGVGAYRTVPDLAMRTVFDELSYAGVAMPGGMEERIVGGATYVRSGLLDQPDGWRRLQGADETAGSVDAAAEVGRMLVLARAADSGELLRGLVASGTLLEVGAEPLDGVPTTRFAGELHADALGGGVVARVDVDVWVDAAGRVRRFAAVAPTEAGRIRLTLTFDDPAVVPDIEVPPV